MRRLLVVPAALVAALAYLLLDAEFGLRALARLSEEVAAVHAENEDLRRRIRELEEAAAALEGDPFAIERALREDLHYARPGETVVVIAPED